MTDFKKALAEGLEVGRDAEDARSEISSVFEDLNAQLLDATGGRIEIRRVTLKRHTPGANVVLEAAAYAAGWRPAKYQALIAKDIEADTERYVELAEWRPGPYGGYPCVIIYGDSEFSCGDKHALESALSDMLKWPDIGAKLYKFIPGE